MPAIGSLPMALSEIKTEFSGPNTMSSYLRGGTYVPNITENNAVATALPLVMSTFVGAVNRTFGLAIGTITAASSFSASAVFTINRNGIPWTVPTETTIGDGYEVRVVQNSGDTLTTGALNTWLALTSNRTWELFNNVASTTLNANVTITIRVAGGGTTVATETLDMSAEVYP